MKLGNTWGSSSQQGVHMEGKRAGVDAERWVEEKDLAEDGAKGSRFVHQTSWPNTDTRVRMGKSQRTRE